MTDVNQLRVNLKNHLFLTRVVLPTAQKTQLGLGIQYLEVRRRRYLNHHPTRSLKNQGCHRTGMKRPAFKRGRSFGDELNGHRWGLRTGGEQAQPT